MSEIAREFEAALVVGTHAVIQEQVKFKNLALAVIDEQHRFGVAQRAAIERVYGQIAAGSAAQEEVSEFYRRDPPAQRGRTMTVGVPSSESCQTSFRYSFGPPG